MSGVGKIRGSSMSERKLKLPCWLQYRSLLLFVPFAFQSRPLGLSTAPPSSSTHERGTGISGPNDRMLGLTLISSPVMPRRGPSNETVHFSAEHRRTTSWWY